MNYLTPWGYCAGSISELSQFQDYPYVQVTMNGRVFPSRRDYVSKVKSYIGQTKLVLHYDFIYILSRYSLFAPYVKQAILNELIALTSIKQDNFVGIVMHTDFPFQQKFISDSSVDSALKLYDKAIWNQEVFRKFKEIDVYSSILVDSLLLFYKDYKSCHGVANTKIFLENTTKTYVPPLGTPIIGSSTFLSEVLQKYPDLTSLFGLCVDTEHQFAVSGYQDVHITQGIDAIVHLNTIPPEVEPFSKKDRHSFTTIYECSQKDSCWYQQQASDFMLQHIPVIREVKDETRIREIEQWTGKLKTR